MTFGSANSVCIIGTLAVSPRAPAVSHRLSVIPISFNSALLQGLLAVRLACLSSHSKCTAINWTRILYNTSLLVHSLVHSARYKHVPGTQKKLPSLKATQEILHLMTHPDRKIQFWSDNGFILGRDDARPTLAVGQI